MLWLLRLLVLELRRVEVAIVGHKHGGIHHGIGRIRVIHREAVSIVVLDGVVHPGAHVGSGADNKLDWQGARLAIKKYAKDAPLDAMNSAEESGDGAVSRHGGR